MFVTWRDGDKKLKAENFFINIKDGRWEKYKINFAKIIAACDIDGIVSITLTDDREIRALNKKYRSKDSPTNVLSFESGDSELLGDIFISFDTAMREDPKNFVDHVTHLVVHGILHLSGYDHIKRFQAWRMERYEVRILKRLGISNPYSRLSYNLQSVAIGFSLFLIGMAGAFGFAPWHYWWTTVLSLGVMYWIYNKKDCSKFMSPFVRGAGYGVMSFSWSLESIFANDEIAAKLWWLYPIGLIAIAIGSGFIFGLPFWMTRMRRVSTNLRPILFATAWAFVEWLREWLLTGFPWNPVSNITLGSPFDRIMAVVGSVGLSFFVVAAVAAIFEKTKWKFLFLIPFLSILFLPKISLDKTVGSVRVISTNFDMNQKFSSDAASEIINKLEGLAKQGAKKFDLIVFPETAYPYAINDTVKMPALGMPIVMGAVYYDSGKFYNSMVLANGQGKIVDKYFKSHLVPFGEYRPFGDVIMTPGQLNAGDGPKYKSKTL